jgi:hypothetical protein
MTTTPTSQPVPDATTPGSPAIAGGVFTRLNPADGLFLRAEHLDRMERYASDLVAAVGAGLGPGVVYGFTCSLSKKNDAVHATGGLAFAAGQPLRSKAMTTVSLKDLQPQGDDNFWVVEIVPATWEYGSEPVYGGLCEDPCGRGSGIQPYAAEGVELKLRQDSLTGFSGIEDWLQRNWLASNYFEREREYGGTAARSSDAPWLLPNMPSGTVQDITVRPWSEGTGHHDHAAVPLGVVWNRDGKWYLDVWTARRDRGEPTPAAAWEWRLGWRPRSVFIAQILQFQDQLAQADLSAVRELPRYVKQALEYLGAGQELVGKMRSKNVEPAVDHLVKAYEALAGREQSSLCALGFEELPPAGYLPWGFEDVDDRQTAAQTLFGPEVDVRVRKCRADFVAHAIEQVQHMDRIPLKGHVDGKPKIDLLIPCEPSDLKAIWTSSYGWSAFVRRREERRDLEDVWIATLDDRQSAHLPPDDVPKSIVEEIAKAIVESKEAIAEDGLFSGKYLCTVSYPQDEWAVPIVEDKSWYDVVHELPQAASNMKVVWVAGVAATPQRRPLAAARANLFVTPPPTQTDGPVELHPTYVAAVANAREFMVLVFARADATTTETAQHTGTKAAALQVTKAAAPQPTKAAAPQPTKATAPQPTKATATSKPKPPGTP